MEAGRGVSERCWDSWSKSLEGISAQSYEHMMRFNEEMSSLSSTGVQVLPGVWVGAGSAPSESLRSGKTLFSGLN